MLWIDDDQAQTAWLTLECQPLFTLAGTIHGQALLYRGATLGSWLPTNVAVAKHLGKYELEFSKVFVNLANGALTAVNDEAFVPALQNNSVVFRLSGQYLCTDSVANIVSKVNRLLAEGIQFAINGFGIGVDGLLRKYCLAEISYVKIDGAFLHTCHECNDEAAVLRYLVKTWQRRAGRCEQDA